MRPSSPNTEKSIPPDFAAGRDFSLSELWRVLSFRRATIAWITASALALALLVSFCMPMKYAAESAIEINPESPGALDPESAPAAAQPDYAVTLATQADILQSDTLAIQVIQQLHL